MRPLEPEPAEQASRDPGRGASRPMSGRFSRKGVLDPYDRVSEVLFGLIMVLTFTGSLSVAQTGRQDIRAMLIGALGCNLAWGLIDAVFYLMSCLAEKGTGLSTLRAVRQAAGPQEAHRVIREALPSALSDVLRPADVDTIHQRLLSLPEPARHARVGMDEWRGALGVFVLVFVSTFPVVIPFMVLSDVRTAMRFSNAIAMAMLFVTGMIFGRLVGRRPWVTGIAMVLLGGALVALTMALGG